MQEEKIMNEQIKIIDDKLAKLLEALPYSQYISIIYNNPKIRLYDHITGRIEIGDLPDVWLDNLSEAFLYAVEKEIDSEIRRLFK